MKFSWETLHHRVSYAIVFVYFKSGMHKFYMVVPIICEFSVWKLLYVTLLAPTWNFEVARRILENLCTSILKRPIFFHKSQKSIQLRWAMWRRWSMWWYSRRTWKYRWWTGWDWYNICHNRGYKSGKETWHKNFPILSILPQ